MKPLMRFLLTAAAIGALSGCVCDRESIYQVSTLQALMEGVYDGDTTVSGLMRHGDFGIGTFNALDGEMVCVGGRVYQVRADGKAIPASGDLRTPFACVTWFDVDESAALPGGMDFEQFRSYLDGRLPTANLPYAVRVEGAFSQVRTRSVPAQTKPYPRLTEVTKNQPTFNLEHVRGVLVGFRLPQYVDGINVPGYHMHFVTEDRRAGGHVLDFKVEKATVEVDTTPRLKLVLPETGAFSGVDLTQKKKEDISAVEK